MFQFESPQYLYLLLLVPACIVGYLLMLLHSRQRLRRLGAKQMVEALMPRRSRLREHIKFGIIQLALALVIVMVARPQFGLKQEEMATGGIEVVVMVDVSNSMMARDIQPSRLDRTKLLLTTMVEKMKNDKVALGVFAGEAYPQMPITADYASAKMFIDALSTDMVTLQGTNLAAAIELGCQSFTDNKEVGKAIVIITDGEDHEGGAEEAAEAAAKDGINVFVIGVGTKAGGQIPTAQGMLLDANGQPVTTALSEDMCRKVAAAGKGIYLHLDQTGNAQDELQAQLARLKHVKSKTAVTARDEQFQAVGLLVIALLILDVCILETRTNYLRRFKIFKKK